MEMDKKTIEKIAELLVKELMESEDGGGKNIYEMEKNIQAIVNRLGTEVLKDLLEEKDESDISKKNSIAGAVKK